MKRSRLAIAILAAGVLCIICSSGQLTSNRLVDITNLHSGDNVSWRTMVEGSSLATENSGLKVYLLIWPIEADGPWWIQHTQTFSDGTWESHAYFGRDPRLYPEDIGTSYRVAAIMTNHSLDQEKVLNQLPIASRLNRSDVTWVRRI